MAGWGYGLLGPLEVRVNDRADPAHQRQAAPGAGDAAAGRPAGWSPQTGWWTSCGARRFPQDPPAALRTQVSRLRRALGPAGGRLVTADGGYRLSFSDASLMRPGSKTGWPLPAGRPASRPVTLLDQALDLWRGPALAEFAWPVARAARSRPARRAPYGDAGTPGWNCCCHSESRRTPSPPCRRSWLSVRNGSGPEGCSCRLSIRAARHTDALATFRSWRRYLSEELGLDPSPPALQRIEQEILQHALPPPDSLTRPVSRALPLPVTSFVGRDEDRLAVADLLGEVRLLTLHGPGGVGKTRLALEVTARIGHRYRDGVCFCDLAAIRRPAAVARAIATAAGLSERAFRRLDDQLIDNLAGRQLLLVLDNCQTSRMTSPLSPNGCCGRHGRSPFWRPAANGSGSTASTSGRSNRWRPTVPAHLRCACSWTGPGAADPAVRRDTEDTGAITTLCARLDGLPLAIELAAARLPGTTACELAGNLDDRFGLLTAGHRAHRRHHSLRAVVDWSYQQLTPAEQQLFGQLSVFQGWFDIGAARAVAAPAAAGANDVTHLVLHLADRSLITADRDDGTARYRLLETLRSYGLERLEERGELDTACSLARPLGRRTCDAGGPRATRLRRGRVGGQTRPAFR